MRILSLILAIVPLLSFKTLANVLSVSPQGFSLENTVQVPATAQQSWEVLTQHVDAWWPKDHTWWGQQGRLTITPKAGGCFCEWAGDKSAQHMSISYVEPGTTLRMLGGLGPLQQMGLNGALTWQLTPENNGTTITLTYHVSGHSSSGFEKLAEIVDKVQAIQLGGLKEYIKTRN